MRWPLLLLSTLVLIAGAKPQSVSGMSSPPFQSSVYSKEFRSRKDVGNLVRVELRNGLTILVEEHPLYPLVAVVTYVKSGYAQEDVEVPGVSHLLQNLYTYQSGIAERIGSLGARLSVKTEHSSTVFQSCGPVENWASILNIHADIHRAPELDAGKIALEANALVERRRHEIQLPQVFARQKLLQMLFPHQPVDGFGAAIDPSSVLKKTEVLRESLADLHTSHYHPSNVIVVISGAVNRDRVLKKAVELFGELTPASSEKKFSKPSTCSVSLGKKEFLYQQLRGDFQQPYLELAYRLAPVRSGDYYPLLLLSYILGKGRDSLLRQSPLVSDGSILDFEIELKVRKGSGAFFFSLLPGPERLDGAEVEIFTQLEFLRRSGIPLHQLDRAKALLLRDHYMRLQSLTERAHLLAYHEAEGDFQDRERLALILQEITPKQVSQALDRYFRDSNLCLLEYLPRTAPERTFSTEGLLETLRLLAKANVAQRVGPGEVVGKPTEKSTFRPPEFIPHYLKYEVKRTTILRGPVVYFQEEHVLPLVHLGIFFSGGRVDESEKNAGITELLIRSMLRSALTKNSKQGIVWERLGLETNLVNEFDFFGFTVTVLSSYIEQVFGTLLEWIRTPIFREEDVYQERQSLLASLQRVDTMGFLDLLNLTKARIFGQHPYGLNRYGTPESVGRLTRDSLQDWFTLQMKEVYPLIVVRGDVEGTSFLRNFVSLLSKTRYSRQRPRKIEKPKSSGSLVVAEKGENVMLAFGGPPKGSRDEALVDVAKSALVGANGSLMQQLRNDQSLASDVSMLYRGGLNGGAIFVHAIAFEGKEKAVSEAILQELEKLKSVVIPEPEFLALLVQTITTFMVEQQRGKHFVLELTRNIAAGQGPDYARKYLARIKSANRNDLMALARRYFVTQRQPGL